MKKLGKRFLGLKKMNRFIQKPEIKNNFNAKIDSKEFWKFLEQLDKKNSKLSLQRYVNFTKQVEMDEKVKFYYDFHLGWLNLLSQNKNESNLYFTKALKSIQEIESPYKQSYYLMIMSNLENDPYKAFDYSLDAIIDYKQKRNEIKSIETNIIEPILIQNNNLCAFSVDSLFYNQIIDKEWINKHLKLIERVESLNDPSILNHYLYSDWKKLLFI